MFDSRHKNIFLIALRRAWYFHQKLVVQSHSLGFRFWGWESEEGLLSLKCVYLRFLLNSSQICESKPGTSRKLSEVLILRMLQFQLF